MNLDDLKDERELDVALVFDDLADGGPPLREAARLARARQHDNAAERVVEHFLTRQRPVWPAYRFEDRPGDWPGATVLDRANALTQNRLVDYDGNMVDLPDSWATPDVPLRWGFLRHYWLHDLAAAYGRTADEKYAQAFERLFTRWLDDCPFVLDPRFKPNEFRRFGGPRCEGLAASYQCLEQMDALAGPLRQSASISRSFWFRFIVHLWFVALQHRRFAEDDYRRDNHFLMERGVAPFALGVFFGESKLLRLLCQQGAAIICRQFDDATLPDGTSQEHSISYSQRCLMRFLLPHRIAAANAAPLLDERQMHRLRQWMIFHRHAQEPGGLITPVGDGGVTVSLHEQQIDCEPQYGVTAPAWQASSLQVYANNAYVFMRDAWDERANFLAISVPNECRYNIHLHHDIFSFNLVAMGERIIGDPATGLYGAKSSARRAVRGYLYNTDAHNVLQVNADNLRSYRALGHLNTWGGWGTRGRVERWAEAGRFCAVSLYHENYNPVLHRRIVLFVKQCGWVMIDQLMPTIEGTVWDIRDMRYHQYTQRLHADPAVRVAFQDGQAWFAGQRAGVWVVPAPLPRQQVRFGQRPDKMLADVPQFQPEPPTVVFLHRVVRGPALLLTAYIPSASPESMPQWSRSPEQRENCVSRSLQVGHERLDLRVAWSRRTLPRDEFRELGQQRLIEIDLAGESFRF